MVCNLQQSLRLHPPKPHLSPLRAASGVHQVGHTYVAQVSVMITGFGVVVMHRQQYWLLQTPPVGLAPQALFSGCAILTQGALGQL